MTVGLQKSGFLSALRSETLDKSDYILICLGLLQAQDECPISNESIKHIRNLYIQHEYNEAIHYIQLAANGLCEKEREIVLNATFSTGNPTSNFSRRYFDTQFSKHLWAQVEREDFEALTRLVPFLKASVGKFKELEKYKKNDDLKVEVEAIEQLPDSVVNQQGAYDVLDVFRTFGSHPDVNSFEAAMRDKNPISQSKDRGGKKDKDAKVYSQYSGILKSIQPAPYDELTENEKTKNRLPDTFEINNKKNGFSKSNRDIPFVNSISGTLFARLAVLKHAINSGVEITQTDFERYIRLSIAFTCMNGYHSLGEMIAVVNDFFANSIYLENGLNLNFNYDDSALDEVFIKAQNYSAKTHLKSTNQTNLTRGLQQKNDSGWHIKEMDASEYLRSLRDKNPIMLDTRHTVLQNAYFHEQMVGEICELMGDYDLRTNIAIKPERLALMHTTAFVETELQRNADAPEVERKEVDDLEYLVFDVYLPQVQEALEAVDLPKRIREEEERTKEILTDIQLGIYTDTKIELIQDQFLRETIRLFKQIYDYRQQIELGRFYSKPYFDSENISNPELAEMVQIFRQIFENRETDLGKYYSRADLDVVINRALFTRLYNHNIAGFIGRVVEEVGMRVTQERGYAQLEPQPFSDRNTFVIVGAPSSGKGSVTKQAYWDTIDHLNIEWRNICKINTDDYREVVSRQQNMGGGILDDEARKKRTANEKRNDAQLNNFEAQYITHLAYQRYDRKLEKQQAPHLLVDAVFPSADRMHRAQKDDGQCFLYGVTLDVNVAMERMINRGKVTGRFVGVDYFLNAHKHFTQAFLDRVKEASLNNQPVTFVLYDNNVAFGETPITVLSGNAQDREITIEKLELASNFIVKSSINPDARSPEEVYSVIPTDSVDEVKTQLEQVGYVIVDAESKLIDKFQVAPLLFSASHSCVCVPESIQTNQVYQTKRTTVGVNG